MSVLINYAALRKRLTGYLDQVTDDRELVIVRRRGARDVAMVPADELPGLMETTSLPRSVGDTKADRSNPSQAALSFAVAIAAPKHPAMMISKTTGAGKKCAYEFTAISR